jgi:hypothetical protein
MNSTISLVIFKILMDMKSIIQEKIHEKPGPNQIAWQAPQIRSPGICCCNKNFFAILIEVSETTVNCTIKM